MAFFEPLPPPPRLEPHRQPEWLGPADNVLGAGVPLTAVLARTDDLAIVVDHVTAYPNGFELHIQMRLREVDEQADPFTLHAARRGFGADAFRFGVQFSDGSKATNGCHPFPPPDAKPGKPVLVQRGGGGGAGRWDMGFWVWGLPTPGSLLLVCAWPAKDVPETSVELDAQPILDAAARAEELWPGGNPGVGGGHHGHQTLMAFRKPDEKR